MEFKVVLLLIADAWMIYAGYVYGARFIRQYSNYFLGIEWMVIALSGSNVVVLGMIGGDHSSPSYGLMLFFDAFSRSFGITLILVLGMLRVTHRYKPSPAVDVGAFGLAIVTGLYLAVFGQPITTPWAIFYIVMNALASLFMFYVAFRLWGIDERRHAVWVAIATVGAAAVAGTYDFIHIPGDDENHTIFYTIAITLWALQMTTYFFAYRALHNHDARVDGDRSNVGPGSYDSVEAGDAQPRSDR
ncbi:transporter [Streptomyces sp. NPDC055721]|uniref:transporter n=1 Tax=Streptomyces sp. NPDC127132 TaxID=3345374 RepID=UPI003636AD5F